MIQPLIASGTSIPQLGWYGYSEEFDRGLLLNV
jgi:hypothetical protein